VHSTLPNCGRAKSGLNKSIADAGWGQCVQYCTYKAKDDGSKPLASAKGYFTNGQCHINTYEQNEKQFLMQSWWELLHL